MALTRTFGDQAMDNASGTVLATDAIDTTGFTAAVIFFKHEGAGTTETATDSNGNSWNPLTKIDHSNGDLHGQLHWANLASAGAGHTFTITLAAARAFRDIRVWLIAGGSIALDVGTDIGDSDPDNIFIDPDAGDLVTSAQAVLVNGVGGYVGGLTYTAGTGWTEDSDTNNNYSQSRAEAASGTFPAECVTDINSNWVSVAAAFIAAAGGGGLSIPIAMSHYLRLAQ